ncbi:hypothetical protein T484DRAFT_1780149 [Baffinella frigidus]|nr:hypothetical protein T484DRAFT_1780149 [Cryptophyta sp. CCMP2293]
MLGIIAAAMLLAFCCNGASGEPGTGPMADHWQHARDAWTTVSNSAEDTIESTRKGMGDAFEDAKTKLAPEKTV